MICVVWNIICSSFSGCIYKDMVFIILVIYGENFVDSLYNGLY